MAVSEAQSQDLWVFAYGSLLWNPGFPLLESMPARVRGYHRSLCVYSHVHRGTPQNPGLVLGLDRGGACKGLAYRVCGSDAKATLDYLRAREQVTAVYREARLVAELADGRAVSAVAYVVDRAHHQYAGRLPAAVVLQHVVSGIGISGANVEYVLASHAHLRGMGIRDPMLEQIAELLARSSSATLAVDAGGD
jgi:cation transport protein ChaC